jgi:Endonuclease/Exonuclease/phosphatase family
MPAPTPPDPRPPGALRVVQCNILHGGWPYEIRGTQLWVNRDGTWEAHEKDFVTDGFPPGQPQTGDPGTEFAGHVKTLRPDVIGMQEVTSKDVDRLRSLLGSEWRNTPPLDGYGASGIFWNSDTVDVSQPEQVEVVQRYVEPGAPPIPIRVLKQVCVHKESQTPFAAVTGKSWYRGSLRDRELRARRTRDFARRGRRTTVIAIDMSPPRSPAFKRMAPFVAKGSEKTCPAGICAGRGQQHRHDHVFYYSPRLTGPQTSGIIRCETGPFFGSDHLFVWADVKLP